MKLCTVVGARPQFIKAAVVSRELRKTHKEILIHTGQHYDKNMSEVFFSELDIPKPDYNLGISGGSHGKMTGEMLIAIEKVLLAEKPDMLILYGDTNSTLAGALAAVKLHIPVCHIEAGNRLGSLTNPEEVNRVLTDRVSSILCCCVESSVAFLKNEGMVKNVFLTGDPMYDAFIYYKNKITHADYQIDLCDFDEQPITLPDNFYYLTCHRPENESEAQLSQILSAMNALEYPTIYPVHPRNKDRIQRINQAHHFTNIIFSLPVPYLTSVYLTVHCKKIVTDSGGLQREAFFAKKQCVTIFDYAAWPETMVGSCNQLALPCKDDILTKLNIKPEWKADYSPFGDGFASRKIAACLVPDGKA